MTEDLEKGKYDGVEAYIKPVQIQSYYDKSYQCIMEININKLGKRKMIGTPTLWKTKKFYKIIILIHIFLDPQMTLICVTDCIQKVLFLEEVAQQ